MLLTVQGFGRTHAHAGRTLLIKTAQIAFHRDGTNARTQSSSELTRAGAGGAGGAFGVLAFAGICSGRLPENSIAPNGQAIPHSLQLTHRLSFSCTAPSTRLMALTGHTVAQGASSHWWQSCGADSFHLTSLSGAALTAGHAGDESLSRRLHRCGSQYKEWSQQLQNDSPGIPQVIVIFDENMSAKCHFDIFRHAHSLKHRDAVCKPHHDKVDST